LIKNPFIAVGFIELFVDLIRSNEKKMYDVLKGDEIEHKYLMASLMKLYCNTKIPAKNSIRK